MIDFNKISNIMAGSEVVDNTHSSLTGLTKDSSDIEILDYIMVQLCHCLDTSKIAFKGGYVLNKIITNEVPRSTVDIDFSIAIKEYYSDVTRVLRSVGEDLVSDGIVDSYEVKDTITETSSGGIKLCRDDSSIKNLGVDVGLHNIATGVVPVNIMGVDVKRFSTERMLSDKISAIYSRKRFRRPKDLYDFYIITNCFDVNMTEMKKQVDIRNTIDWSLSPMRTEVAVQYKIAYDKLHVIHPMTREDVNKPPFEKALGRVSTFVQNWGNGLVWKHDEGRFV